MEIGQPLTVRDGGWQQMKLLLDYADLVGGIQGRESGVETPTHVLWTCDRDDRYPAPSLDLGGQGAINPLQRQAIQLILRHPGPYDGGVEFQLERCLWSVIKVLFDDLPVAFLQ